MFALLISLRHLRKVKALPKVVKDAAELAEVVRNTAAYAWEVGFGNDPYAEAGLPEVVSTRNGNPFLINGGTSDAVK